MSDVKWIKITTDMFDNRKIRHLRKLPEGNSIVLIWVMLLAMAGKCNDHGKIYLTENIPYTPKMLADELDFEENTVQLALQALEQLDMIVLYDGYFSIDACELIKETEKDIRRLKKKRQTIVQTNVSGSNPEFPYNPQHFKIAGTAFTYEEDSRLRYEEKILEERRENAQRLKVEVEQWMNHIPQRMQRIIKYKVFEGLSWSQVAAKLGRKATADSVRMEYLRFMEAA